MATRATFLNTAYRAYHHRERAPEDTELIQVGPGTPCGEYLRRFWHPMITSAEVQDLPRRLRVMGLGASWWRIANNSHNARCYSIIPHAHPMAAG